MPVAPRIVNDVSYVMQINHDTPLAWQAHGRRFLLLRAL